MKESDNLSETKRSDFYENKIQRLTNELEIQNQKRNQEMEELFEDIDTENTSLKKELLETKEELKEEKDKNNSIKNSIYNFNYYQLNLDDPINDKNIIINKNNIDNNNNNYNSSLFCDNIKQIKEENAAKISELDIENEAKIKNFEKNWNSLETNIKNLLDIIKQKQNNDLSDKSNSDRYNNINNKCNEVMDEINNYNNKINALIKENYSNKKYAIILLEKIQLAQEEIDYLKERILQEKKIILEKINEISHMNILAHVNFSQEIINEINSKRKNFFNSHFLIPLDNLNQLLLESKENEKDLKNKNDVLKKELDDLKSKYEIVNEQKNDLLKNASNYIVQKEKDNTNELILYSQINKLKKEKNVLENEINSLLKNNQDLNEQILSINNKIQYELSQAKKKNDILLNQKNDIINNLNNK